MSAAENGSRRRATKQPAVRPDASAIVPVVLVLVAVAAVLLLQPAQAPAASVADTAGPAAGGLVEHTTFACPDEDAGRRVATTVRLGLAPTSDGLQPPEGGSVRQGPVDSAGEPVEVPRGRLVEVPADGGPAVDASGGAAAGLFGFRTHVGSRTLGIASCVSPRAEWWFTGAGAGLDHASILLLANVDPGPAVVDVRVLGPDGEVETVATNGITIPPRTVHRIDLSDIAPQTDELAVSVHAHRGRVAASVTDSYRRDPTASPGQEWLAGTDTPSRTVRLAGLPARSDASTLLVANPSDLEAVVEVRVAGRSGSFAPTGLDAITVAPGALVEVDLENVLPGREAVALRLRARVPVVASVRSVDVGDQAYAVPVAPLLGAAAAPMMRGADASVQLTAGALRSRVTAAAYDADGKRVDGTTLKIAPTATRTWSPKRSADYVVLTPSTAPGNGPVHGAVTYAGDGLAALPLTALPLRIDQPSVRPGLG